jgi:curved DNA-binding protein
MTDSLENQYDNEKFVDYYKILDIDIEATQEEIKHKYIELAKKYHPDQKTGNTELFQLISKAYELLSNKETRKEYDLYFLKQSFDEIQEDSFYKLKDNFNEFITMNDNKKLSKEELDKLCKEVFNDVDNFNEFKLDNSELSKRTNDLLFERDSNEIETTDDRLKNIIENNPNIKVDELLDFIKETEDFSDNKEIVSKELMTLDTLPGYFDNCASFDDSGETIGSELFSSIDTSFVSSKEKLKNFNLDDYKNWKVNKKLQPKLDTNDIESFLNKRKIEEEQLLEEVESSLITNVKKRTDVEVFLKTKNHINDDDIVKQNLVNNVKKRTF